MLSRPYLSNSALLLDLSLQWDLTTDLQLTAGVFNLLDKQYYRWERIRMINPSQAAAALATAATCCHFRPALSLFCSTTVPGGGFLLPLSTAVEV